MEEIRRQRALQWERSVSSRERSRSPRKNLANSVVSSVSPLRVLSWNIDGLDDHSDEVDMLGRTLWVIEQIALLCPHIVFLQELIEFNYSILFQKLGSAYHFIKQEDCVQPYFVAILVHKRTMQMRSPETVLFPSTKMGRGAVCVQARLLNSQEWFGFVTAHLESLAESANERKSQLAICLQYFTPNRSWIFGGDLNIRDPEVPAELAARDCWMLKGSDKGQQYTWDMSRNDNPQMKGKPRCRFDRFYTSEEFISKFELVGTERVPGLGRFASDHFGIFLEVAVATC